MTGVQTCALPISSVSVEGEGGLRFGTSVFLFAMNRDRYEALPGDLRAVIDANSGRALAEEMGDVWNRVEQQGISAQEKSGGEVVRLDAEATAAFRELGAEVTARWIEEAGGQGFDAGALVEAAKAAVQAHTAK